MAIHEFNRKDQYVDYIIINPGYAERIRSEIINPERFKASGLFYMTKYDVLPIKEDYLLYYKGKKINNGK